MDQMISEGPNLISMEIESQKENQDQAFESVFNSMKLRPGGLKRAQEGVTYQVALISLVAVNSYDKLRKDFNILCEDESFGKFDDVVLELKDFILFYQVKHRKNKTPYSVNDFTKGTGRKVGLADYFRSYIDVKEKFGDKKLNFIFFFNSGFNGELVNCTTQVSSFEHDEMIFQGFKGETRIFDFEKNTESKKAKEKFIQALGPSVALHLQNRKAIIEVELPDINNDDDITQFIKTLSEILEKCSHDSENILNLARNKAFESSKPLFLSILDLDPDEMEKSEVQLNFTEDFIFNNDLTGISKKIRDELVSSKGEAHLKAVLENTSVKCPKNLFELETVAEPRILSNYTSKDFSFSEEVLDENRRRVICCFGSKKDQFLLMSLFRHEKESGSFILEHLECESDFKSKIWKTCFNIVTKRVKSLSQNPEQEYDFNNQECFDFIDEFLHNLHFKIHQPTYEELHELAYEKIKGLADIGSREIQQTFFVWLSAWLASPKTTKLKGHEYHKQFQDIKANLRRRELFRDTLPFCDDCKQRLSVLAFSDLDLEDPLKIFLENTNVESLIFVVSEEGVGMSRLYAYKAISEIDRIQKDSWAFIDIKVDHFQSLRSHLKSTDLQYIIVDIPIELNESKYQLLDEFLMAALREKKKVILLNTHVQKEIQVSNFELVCNITQNQFYERIAKKLEPWQIEAVCQNYQEKYVLAGEKYRQIRDILADLSCGIYQAMSHPEYLYEILQNSENAKEDQIFSQPFYIQNEIVYSVPLYSLKMLLMQTTAKIIWLKNSPSNIHDLLERWFPDQIHNDKGTSKEKKNKIGPYWILRNLDPSRKSSKYPTYKGRIIVTKNIDSKIYQRMKRNILHIYCPDNQQLDEGMKKSLPRNSNKSLMTYQVEIIEKNDLVRLIKPISFKETSQVQKAHTITQDNLLERRSSQSKRGNVNWISANAGMGKTYLLNELKRRWQNLEASWSYDWVFVIDLAKIDYSKITEKTTLEDFLVDISPEFDRKQTWLRTALEHDKNSGRILLLFDAWDEVKPLMHERIEILISKIPSNIDFMIVTRPYGLNSIDLSRWDHNYFTLKPFNEELVNKYIEKFFFQENFSGDYLEKLSRKISEWMRNLGRNFSQILGIPLQISQLCQIFFSKVQKGFDFNISEWFDENKPLNIVRLYDQFIETVFCKICHINSEDPEVLYGFWQKYFYYLSTQAYQQLFDKSERYIEDYHSLDQLPSRSIELLLRTGLIKPTNLNDGKIEFAHQTYKEYFGAFYLLRILCGKNDSDLCKEVVKDISDNKYMEYYQMVFLFAFQISFHGHPLLLQNQDQKEDLVRKFWKILHRDPKDLLGRASNKLSSACLSPLTNKQKEEFFDLIPEMYRPKEILLRKERNIWIPTPIWVKNSLAEEMNEELGDDDLISLLKDKSEVLRFTREFIQKCPHKKKQLAGIFKYVFEREDLDWFWDMNGGFQALALLGDDFDEDHAAYFKKRILIDPSRRVEPVVSAILLLGRAKNEVIKEVSSILLMIFGRFGARFSHILDVIVQNIHPSRLIYALINLIGAAGEFEDPLSLIFAIAYIAEYAIIPFEEKLFLDTGKKRLTLLKHLTNDQNDYLDKIQKEYNPSTCNYIYFLNRRLRIQDISREIFLSMSIKEKENIIYDCFLDGKEAKETATWLQKHDFLKGDFANILVEISANHQGKFDNWARDGGWCAITKMGKYFNKRFGDFLHLRGQLWSNNIPDIEKELLKLGQDLEDLGKENFNDNEVNVAWKCLQECLGQLREELRSSRQKYLKEKFPRQKHELSRTAAI